MLTAMKGNSLPMTDRIIHKNWETPKEVAKTDKQYNHHKVLIFACYRLYKYVNCNERKLTSNDRQKNP